MQALPFVQCAIVHTPAASRSWFAARCAASTQLVPQCAGDLGERVIGAFDSLFGGGADAVLLTDSDTPNLPVHYLADAARALHEGHEMVLGPALDGGYYLVGLRRPRPDVFAGVPWSTDAALERTLGNARALGLEPFLLPPWYDVDAPMDLERLAHDIAHGRGRACPRTEAGLRSLGWLPPKQMHHAPARNVARAARDSGNDSMSDANDASEAD
jgi:glycosyltransferase A (GT-A) superfamily protein (DUF2064 family)